MIKALQIFLYIFWVLICFSVALVSFVPIFILLAIASALKNTGAIATNTVLSAESLIDKWVKNLD